MIIIATVIEVENRKHKVLKHRHKHALRESRPERDAGGIQLKPEATRNKLFPGYGTNFRYIGEVKKWVGQGDSGHIHSHSEVFRPPQKTAEI